MVILSLRFVCAQYELSLIDLDLETATVFDELWLIHIARNRDRDRECDKHNRKQWSLVPFLVSDQCEHFCTTYLNPLMPCTCPGPVQCEYAITAISSCNFYHDSSMENSISLKHVNRKPKTVISNFYSLEREY